MTRSEADLLDIRNFGQKSIDEVKAKLISLGLSLKDSPAGFDPTKVAGYYDEVEDENEEVFVEDEKL
jgi:DNA-directed RNA polymerase subunit alpha